jgi:hypothetical protein
MEPSQIDPSRDKAAHMKQARTLSRWQSGPAAGLLRPEEGKQRGGVPAALQAGAGGSVSTGPVALQGLLT